MKKIISISILMLLIIVGIVNANDVREKYTIHDATYVKMNNCIINNVVTFNNYQPVFCGKIEASHQKSNLTLSARFQSENAFKTHLERLR